MINLIRPRIWSIFMALTPLSCGVADHGSSLMTTHTQAARLVVWSDLNGKGTSYQIEAVPEYSKQALTTVDSAGITAQNLSGRISSATITCGSREAEASFGDKSDAYGNRRIINCQPYETKTLNFETGSALADKVKWYSLLVHSAGRATSDLSTWLKPYWKSALPTSYPINVSLKGDVEINWIDYEKFEIKQNLSINDPVCANQSHSFSYWIGLSTKSAGIGKWGVLPVWTVTAPEPLFTSSICRAYYRAQIYTVVQDQLPYIKAEFDKVTRGPKSTYYLSPSDTQGKVIGNWGNYVAAPY